MMRCEPFEPVPFISRFRGHMTKAGEYLFEWSQKTGLPMPSIVKDPSVPVEKDLDLLYCAVCDVYHTCRVNAMAHYEGKPHAKKKRMAEKDAAESFGSDFKKLKEEKPNDEKPKEETSKQAQLPPPSSEKFLRPVMYCLTCQTECKTEEEYNRHVNDHNTKMPVVKGKSDTFCDVCKVEYSDKAAYDAHFSGMEHKLRTIRDDVDRQQEWIEPRGAVCLMVAPIQ